MAEYLILAENVILKNDRLTCINVIDKLATVAMPSEFRFDLAILCGPNWTVGEHKLEVKARANNGKEINIGNLTVNIPNDNFVYNAYANDLKVLMDYSVEELTIVVLDNGKEIITRKYPVIPMLVPQKAPEQEVAEAEVKEEPAKEKKKKKGIF